MILNPIYLKNTDLLVICPTRNRPEQLERMYRSFYKTISARTSLILCVDLDDDTEYDHLCTYSIEERTTITKRINNVFNQYPNFKYYSIANDDFEYMTVGWDYKMMQKGINCPKDPNRDYPFPVTMVIDGDIPRKLGWLQMPTLNHLCGDNVWDTIGKRANCFNYYDDVVVEHHHYLFNKAKVDDTYIKGQMLHEEDTVSFINWLSNHSHRDCEKVKSIYEHPWDIAR